MNSHGGPKEDKSEREQACDAPNAAEYWRWRPRCGHELHNEKCKLRCPRCHYFMSCSDFDCPYGVLRKIVAAGENPTAICGRYPREAPCETQCAATGTVALPISTRLMATVLLELR